MIGSSRGEGQGLRWTTKDRLFVFAGRWLVAGMYELQQREPREQRKSPNISTDERVHTRCMGELGVDVDLLAPDLIRAAQRDVL